MLWAGRSEAIYAGKKLVVTEGMSAAVMAGMKNRFNTTLVVCTSVTSHFATTGALHPDQGREITTIQPTESMVDFAPDVRNLLQD